MSQIYCTLNISWKHDDAEDPTFISVSPDACPMEVADTIRKLLEEMPLTWSATGRAFNVEKAARAMANVIRYGWRGKQEIYAHDLVEGDTEDEAYLFPLSFRFTRIKDKIICIG
jgi:hypothetical protein